MSEKMALVKKRLLVVGYGVAGSQIACQMSAKGKYSVTVLSPYDYMEVPLSMTMVMAAGPEAHDKCIYPLMREAGVDYIIGICASITDGSVTTNTGQTIPFDVCVLATGQDMSIYMPNPLSEPTIAQRKATVAALFNKIKAAKTVLISGGGPLGCETAADIKIRYKDKKVVLVHAQGSLLSTMSWGLPAVALKSLQDMGVEVMLNTKVRYSNS
jgi:NADH dehydrogenase FAD-containing subunit